MNKKRESNFELLRIISMLYVITLHYLDKGDFLPDCTNAFDLLGYIAWILEAFAIVAVNVFFIISGYFLVDSKFKIKRILDIILQTMFYSLVVGGACILFNIVQLSDLDIYKLLILGLPLSMNHYWFMSVYVVLLILAPLFNLAIKNIEKKHFTIILFCLLILESGIKSILPLQLARDNKGYSIIWGIVLYLTGAYIKKYGIKFFRNRIISIVTYISATAVIVVSMLVIQGIYLRYDNFETNIGMSFHYNYIFVYLAAISLFYTFYFIKINKACVNNVIVNISPYVLGVYLFHEHIFLRYEWQKYFRLAKGNEIVAFFTNYFIAIITIFIIGICIDYVRTKIFSFIEKIFIAKGLDG